MQGSWLIPSSGWLSDKLAWRQSCLNYGCSHEIASCLFEDFRQWAGIVLFAAPLMKLGMLCHRPVWYWQNAQHRRKLCWGWASKCQKWTDALLLSYDLPSYWVQCSQIADMLSCRSPVQLAYLQDGSAANVEQQQKSGRPILAKQIMVLPAVNSTDRLSISTTH